MRPITARDLEAIAYQNLRDLGDVDPEVASDIGYAPIETGEAARVVTDAQARLAETTQSAENPTKQRVAWRAGSFICGDCLNQVPRGHSCEF